MKSFTDKDGRVWEISLTIGSALQVKNKLEGVDLLQPEMGDPPLITRLGTDEMFLAEVICALLGDQFEKHGVSVEDIQQSMDGATIMAAQEAFYEELIDFFQSRGRADRAKAVEAQKNLIMIATKKVAEKIENIDLEKVLDDELSKVTPGAISGK